MFAWFKKKLAFLPFKAPQKWAKKSNKKEVRHIAILRAVKLHFTDFILWILYVTRIEHFQTSNYFNSWAFEGSLLWWRALTLDITARTDRLSFFLTLSLFLNFIFLKAQHLQFKPAFNAITTISWFSAQTTHLIQSGFNSQRTSQIQMFLFFIV